MKFLGAGGIISEVTRFVFSEIRARRKSKQAFTNYYNAINEVYDILKVILRNSKASRVVILKTTNGGGKPTLTGNLYGSIVHEDYDAPLQSVKKKWQKQLLDRPYCEMLYEMNKTGFLIVRTEEMEKGILKTIYRKDKIVESWIFKLRERKHEYLYMAINFVSVDQLTDGIKDLLRVQRTNLINIFTNYPK